MSVNKVIILGRLGADPEVKYTPSGTAVAQLSLATNRKAKNQESGDWEDKTEWHRVVFFDKKAEAIGQYVKKGHELYIEGRLQTRKWQDKDGNDKYITEIIAYEFSFVGSKSSSSDNDFQNQNNNNEKFKQKDELSQDPSPQQEDEIPF
ncbi:MAG: single-stranded DNA-binding protein [Pseudomonadota bacterium]|nr:single-stranded DNA-binding protein [Pseudomonadota bacterium]MED5275136.1 single-stranded DNA-binding protein [Pseudomonadota bacterium]|tara:strand:+ start:244 stop:690 length:447 start_codon:yes stop_codon:yes gene_type:complete